MKNLLTNRTFDYSKWDWYCSSLLKKESDTVIDVKLLDTTSSTGSWSGYFVQKMEGKFYMIPFSQETNFPNCGFTLGTGDVFLEFDDISQLEDIVQIFIEENY